MPSTLNSNVNVRVLQPAMPIVRSMLIGCILLGLSAGPGFSQDFSPALERDASDPILIKARIILREGKGNGAEAIYRAYLRENPGSTEALVGLARIAQRRFDYPAARDYLGQALASAPEDVEVVAETARLYHLWSTSPFGPTEDYSARAEEHFRHAEGIDPDNPLLLTYQGEWHLDSGDLVSAERHFQKALRLNPRFVPAYQGLTRYYIRVSDLSRAKETALHAVELDPQNQYSFFQMAQLLALAEHPEKATEYALKSEQLDFGHDPRRSLFLAEQFEKLGSARQAIDYYEKVLESAPGHAPTLMKLARLHEQQGDQEKSIAFYRDAIRQDPALLTGMIDAANAHLRKENTTGAIQQYIRILALSNDPAVHRQALHGLGGAMVLDHFYGRADQALAAKVLDAMSAYGDTNDPLIALDRLKVRIAADGGTSGVLPKLAVIAESSDDLAAGEALFLVGEYARATERLDAVDGETAQGYLAIGDRLLMDQALLSATTMYQRGYQIEPLPEIRQGLDRIAAKRSLAERKVAQGNQLFGQENYREALEPYRQAQKIFPEWETPYMRLGDTHEQLKDKASAYRAYHKAVELNPTLLDSKGFSKKYKRLEKAAQKG